LLKSQEAEGLQSSLGYSGVERSAE